MVPASPSPGREAPLPVIAMPRVAGASVSDDAPDALRERMQRILEDGDYQTELPPPEPSRVRKGPGPVAPEWVSWLVLSLFVATVTFVVARLIRERVARREAERTGSRRKGAPPEAPPPPRARRADLAPAGAALPDPDALAAAGRHADAIHALLLQALATLFLRIAREPPPGRTARELLFEFPAASREPVRGLVALVERGRFAVQPLGEADWLEAQALGAALSQGSAR
jgi:hypothetical protein